MGCGVRILITTRAHTGTQPIASLPQRSAAEDKIKTTRTCVTLFTTEMHVTRLKLGTKSKTVLSANDAVRGTMTINYGPFYDQPY
jgi:hypothetical protein